MQKRIRRKGTAAIEMAMVLLPLVFMILGGLDLGLMFSAWSTVQWASDSAARQIMVASSPSVSQAVTIANTAAINAGYSNNGVSAIDFSGTNMTTCGTLNCIQIVGSYTYQFKLTTIGHASVTLKATAYAPITP